MKDLHWEVLPPTTKATWLLLENLDLWDNFYLAGGTGLALQIGHRKSLDLDFFTEQKFEVAATRRKLSELGNFQLELTGEQTLVGFLEKTKVSFLGYPYPLVSPLIKTKRISLAGLVDIACMKLDAVASRGTKRDFIDLYFMAQRKDLALSNLLAFFQRKYAKLNYNLMHVKKSLIYFAEAEKDSMPQMLRPVSWDEVKSFFRQEITRIV